MLSLKDIDLDMLTSAMENADRDFQCWLDPSTGQIELSGPAVDGGLFNQQEARDSLA